jgi:hypothetical protein
VDLYRKDRFGRPCTQGRTYHYSGVVRGPGSEFSST